MPHWTRALKPYQDEETDETILFYPCPQLPNDLSMAIIRQADGGRTAHSKKLKTCLEEMLEKYTVDVTIWGSLEDSDHQFDLRMWITEARGVEGNVDADVKQTHMLNERWPECNPEIYSANGQDSNRAHIWKEDFRKGHTATFSYPFAPDGIWGIYSYVYE